MPFQHVDIIQMKGLYLQPNTFAVPAGALERALNVVCAYDGIIKKRRGFFEFNTPSVASKAMFLYNNTLVNVMETKVATISGAGTESSSLGAVDTVGITPRAVQASANFYFTTNEGMKKLESTTATVRGSGVPPALDISGRLLTGIGATPIASSAPGTQVAYRVLFGYRDANKNTILGSPGDFLFLTNPAADPAKTAEIQFTIPAEITSTDYFYQIYRTRQSAGEDIPPEVDFKLVEEAQITSAQLVQKFVLYRDVLFDLFLGAFLYTNQNGQEGELQANERPPLAKDVTLFKSYVLYANTTARHRLLLSVKNATSITAGQYITFTKGVTTTRFYARSGVGNSLVSASSVSFASTTITVNYTAHGFSTGDSVWVSNAVGTGTLPSGEYTITVTTANQFTFVAASNPTTLTALDFEGYKITGGYFMFLLSSGVLAENIDATARGLVKAVNRNGSVGIYARYITGVDDVPGKMVFMAQGFGAAFTANAQTDTAGESFFPQLKATGNTVISLSDVLPNSISMSKLSEPEAVPFVNSFPVGARNSAIKRIVSLRDSVIIFKEDGVFRLNADTVDNVSITALDNTIFIKAENSVVVLNNKAMALTTAGVVEVTDSTAAIESRNIEIPVNAVLGLSTLDASTFALSYESERLYLLATILPNQTTATVVWVYNYVTGQWTEWDTIFKGGVVGPEDTLYYTGINGKIFKERKTQTKIDFSGQNYSLTVSSVSADKLTVVFSGTSVIPQVGDIVVKSSFINRVISVSVGVSSVTCVFRQQANVVAADVVTLYSSFKSIVKFAPIHAGSPTRNKHFATFQAVFRSPSCSRLMISFGNEKFGSSEVVTWNSYSSQLLGWGLQPWGTFSWSESELINTDYTTLPNLQVRTYIPRLAGRGVYLQPLLEHNEAGEEFILQAIGIAMRGYSERTTK